MLLWKTVEMSLQRSGRSCFSLIVVMSCPSKTTLPPVMLARRLEQADHGVAERRLAAAGLADEADDLAGLDAEGDVAHGLDRRRFLVA